MRALARLHSRAQQLKQHQRTRTSLASHCKSPRACTHMFAPKAFLRLILLAKASDTCDLPEGEVVSAPHPIQSCNHAEHQWLNMATCANATRTSVHIIPLCVPCRRPQNQTMRTHAAHADDHKIKQYAPTPPMPARHDTVIASSGCSTRPLSSSKASC